MREKKRKPGLLGIMWLLPMAWVIWLFLPVQLGGQTGYIIISGTSMLPGYYYGDLALTRAVDEVQVGDVAAYFHADFGEVFYHRIIGQDGDAWILQGDNNPFPDSYRPTSDEIMGVEWVHIPKIGALFVSLNKPATFTVLIGAFLFLLVIPTSKNDPDPDDLDPFEGKRKMLSNQERDLEILLTFGFVALIGIAGMIYSFLTPARVMKEQPISIQHSGDFLYTAAGTPDIYDQGTAESGDPVYRAVAESLNVSFQYQAESEQLEDFQGLIGLDVIVSDGQGWHKTIKLIELSPFEGTSTEINSEIYFWRMLIYIKSFEKAAGVTREGYYFDVVPLVRVDGKLNGLPIRDEFRPRMRFLLSDQDIRLVIPRENSLSEVLHQEGTMVRATFEEKVNTINFFSAQVPVTTVRLVSLLVFLIGGAVSGYLGYQQIQVQRAGENTGIKYRYGGVIVKSPDRPDIESMVKLGDFEAVLKLADRNRLNIFNTSGDGCEYYYVQLPDTSYYCEIADPTEVEQLHDEESHDLDS